MKVHSALIIFFVSIVVMSTIVVYAQSRTGNPKLYAQNRHRVELGYNSQWFTGEKTGMSCRTWFTCNADGARIRGVYLDRDGQRFALGSSGDGTHFTDQEGRSPVGTQLSGCQGSDHGISVQIYPEVVNNEVTVGIVHDDSEVLKNYRYSLPEGIEELNGPMDATLVFEAQTGDIWQAYEQSSSMQECQ